VNIGNDKHGTNAIEVTREDLDSLVDLAIAKQAEMDARQAVIDAAEARRVQREVERRDKKRQDLERAREAEVERARFCEVFEWICAEPE
jgi:hypothetical protein